MSELKETQQESKVQDTQKQGNRKKENREKKGSFDNIYTKSLITRKIQLPIGSIGKNIYEVINNNISQSFEGKCVVEGFIKPKSSKLISYSSGIVKGANIYYEVVFQCEICCPVEGMNILCVAKNITQAGIRAESFDEKPSPILVFVARDHHYKNKNFSSIKENDVFTIRVIGQRFELNDKYISIIAELVESPLVLEKPKITII
jgi:DNA-directed RNA polymerase subunit E'/Rpb7